MRRLAVAAAGVALVLAVSVGAAGERRDFAAVALNVLPPGENGGVSFDAHSVDQAGLYDKLTPLGDKIEPADLDRLFKPETLGLGKDKPVKVETPRPGVTIKRDSWGVPHIEGKTLADVEFGAGWATAEDRGILLELIRGPARLSALDVPGLNPLALALSGKQFVPSPEAEAFLAQQIAALEARGKLGRTFVRAIDAYVAGINAQYRSTRNPVPQWTRNDVVAAATLIGARFGAGGGDEARRSMFLDALRKTLGSAKGQSVFDDLREANDPEAPVSLIGAYPQEQVPASAPGSVVLDDGSFSGGTAQATEHVGASNALLVGAGRSKTGHPLMVAGPQVGYFHPEFFMEVDLHGAGFDARGALFPGVPFVLLGRGEDYAWSATSSQADNTDLVAETLCGGDDRHYLFKGECRAMGVFFPGAIRQAGKPDQSVSFSTTVHGPVIGYATAGGTKVALAFERSTRGRELLSAAPFYALDTNQVTSAKSFLKTMAGVEFSFNWFYVDAKDIAMFSSGRLPVRSPQTDPALPRIGDGRYEWQGFLPPAQHAQGIAPRNGVILNWNNKPAAGVGAADDNWSYGAVHRVELLSAALVSGKQTLASLVAAMNKAATQDLRAVRLLPILDKVLKSGSGPSARAERMLSLLDAWRDAGSSRLDRDEDGKIDDPGAAIMDAAWPKIAEAVMNPVLGPALVDRLAELHAISDDANSQGSSYIDGWYGYVDKDLAVLTGEPVKGAFTNRYCGAGKLAACRDSLWAAVEAAGVELAAAQGPDPAAWRADATAERIRFAPGILPTTMRWANRPTFQQVISFSSHR